MKAALSRVRGGSRIVFKEGVVRVRVQGKRPRTKGMWEGEGSV